MAPAGCGDKGAEGGDDMTDNVQPQRVQDDASERPGASVILPERNPDMVYDRDTDRVTDIATGGKLSGTKTGKCEAAE